MLHNAYAILRFTGRLYKPSPLPSAYAFTYAEPMVEPMKNRVVRVPDGVWSAAQAKAESEGRKLSDVIRDALRRYVAAKPRRKA